MPKQLPGDHAMHTQRVAQMCRSRNRLSFGSDAPTDPTQQLPSRRNVVYHQCEAAILHMHASMPSRTGGRLLSHHEKESTPRMLALHTADVTSATAHRVARMVYLEEIFKVACCQPLHGRYVRVEPTNCPSPKRGYSTISPIEFLHRCSSHRVQNPE